MATASLAQKVDDETKAALYEGLTISQISRVFGLTPAEVSGRVGTISPSGVRHNVPIYHLRDLMPLLWRPTIEQIDDAMRRLSHKQLPPSTTKEYWAGLRSRQEFMIRAGELWPTGKVISKVGELFKLIKMNLNLMIDTVERQSELTEKQRNLIKGITDGTLRDLSSNVIQNFKIAPDDEDRAHDE